MLFRRNAVDFARARLEGDVRLGAPLGPTVLLLLVVATLMAGAVFLVAARFDRAVTVRGFVSTQSGMARLTAPTSAIVDRVLTTEGATVVRDQALVVLRSPSFYPGGDLGSESEAALLAQDQAEERIAAAERVRYAAVGAEAQARIRYAREQLDARQAALPLMERKLSLAQEALVRSESVFSRGFLTRRELDNAKSSVVDSELALHAVRSDLANLRRELDDAQTGLRQMESEDGASLATADRNRSERRRELAQIRAGKSTSINATREGRVSVLAVSPGDSIAAGETVAVIAPARSPLIAELLLPSHAIGFVERGQTVRLRYDAFPYQTYGTAAGTVLSVSETALAPADLARTGIRLDEPAYRIRVDIHRPSMTAYGREVPVRPGMLLEADVILDRRNALAWFLDPILSAARIGR